MPMRSLDRVLELSADGDRLHTSPVQPTLEGDDLFVPAPSSHVQKNTGQRPKVSLVWPPREPDGDSCVADCIEI